MAQKTILVIQDISCIGRCSALAALPVLCAFGHHATLLPTELLSSHTGFERPHRKDLSDDMRASLDRWAEMSLCFDAILLGYLSGGRQADMALRAVNAYRKEGTLLCVDPAMGDHGRMYAGVEKSVAGAFYALSQTADVLFPNATEAALLTGKDPSGAQADEAALRALLALGAKNVVLTGYEKDGGIGVLAGDGTNIRAAVSKKRAGAWPGTGDLLAAAVTGGMLAGLPLEKACQLAVRFLSDAVHDAGGDPRFGVPFEGRLYQLTNAVYQEGV